MRHCDEETLAALALGEPMNDTDAAHLQACAECRAEATAYAGVAARVPAAARVYLEEPPARVWDAIVAQVASESDAAPGSEEPLVLRAPRESRRPRREPSRLFKPWIVAAAAAAGAIVGGVGVGMVVSQPGAVETQLVAQGDLANLATEDAAGTARVERREDGTEVLVIDTTYEEVDGALEVWLIDTDVQGMVSLGFLTADHGEFVIPAGYAVDAFPIVDISVEPPDGDPTHSGDSVTRGILG